MARPKKDDETPTTPDATGSDSAPRVRVFDRDSLVERLKNPHGRSSVPIRFKDPSLVGRWFNAKQSPNRIWTAKNDLKWFMIRPEDLADLDQIGGYTLTPEGYVARGERCEEVLMAQPKTWRDQIAMAKTEENLRNMGDPNRTKGDIANAAAERFGAQAGEFIDRRVNVVGGVRDQYERIAVTPEIE